MALKTLIPQSEFKEKIKVFSSIRSGQKPLWDDPQRGLVSDFGNVKKIKKLQIASMEQNVPIAKHLEFSSYKKEVVQKALRTLVQELNELDLFEDLTANHLIGKISEHLSTLINYQLILNESKLPISEDPSFSAISVIIDALIQPSMIYISSKCEKDFIDGWGLSHCPVCGQIPSVVVKPEKEVWRFKCSFCLTEYKTDIFTCPICNARDIDSKDFFILEPNQVYEIASCKECNHYFKIINRDKIYPGREIPEGLEDLYTYFLDEIAVEQNLVRIDNN